MCWACLNGILPDAATGREALAAYQTVTTSKALLARLDYPEANWANTLPGDKGPVIVTYSFLENAELPPVSGGTFHSDENFAFSEAQRANFRKALAEFTRVTGLIFVEKSGESMIKVHGTDGSDWAGWANYPNSTDFETIGSTLVIDDDGQLNVGTYGFATALHEIGHAVGLKHPFEGKFRLRDDIDTSLNTVMSYTVKNTPEELARLDVLALQTLYGKPINTKGWAFKVKGDKLITTTSARDDVIAGAGGVENVIRGLGGDDQLLGSQLSDRLYGDEGDDRLNGGYGGDLLFGGAGNDRLNGNLGGGVFYGGQGDDWIIGNKSYANLYGGQGEDHLLAGPVTGHMYGGNGEDVLRCTKGLETGSYYDLASLFGGNGDDTLIGDSLTRYDRTYSPMGQELYGGAGYDVIYGKGENDRLFADADGGVLYGGDGDDTIHGGTNRFSRLNGGAGDDLMFSGKGRAMVYGGTGHDTLWGGDDSAQGGLGAKLFGDGGNDLIYGLAVSDQLFGGAGDDVLFGVAGNRLDGGAGQDRLIFEADMVGQATIAGFEPGVDSIIIQSPSDDPTLFEVDLIGQSGGVLARITPSEGAEVITLFLQGIDLAHVTEDMFIGQTGEWVV